MRLRSIAYFFLALRLRSAARLWLRQAGPHSSQSLESARLARSVTVAKRSPRNSI
jgi:hypothetical protein